MELDCLTILRHIAWNNSLVEVPAGGAPGGAAMAPTGEAPGSNEYAVTLGKTKFFTALLNLVNKPGGHFKAVAEALRVLGGMSYPLRMGMMANGGGNVNTGDFQNLLECLAKMMGQGDIDQEVKEASLDCLGHVLANVGDI